MKRKKTLALPALVIGVAGLCIGGPTAAYAGGFHNDNRSVGSHHKLAGRMTHIGADGRARVAAGSPMAQVADTGCGGHYSDTVLPSTIRVLRGSGQVDVVPFEDYVKNVLPNEWISSWDPASLQAGAMAVKSFAWYWTNHSADRSSGGQCYDVTDNTSSQVYQPGSATPSTDAAVDATWNARMTRDGAVLQAHYCSTDTACPSGWVTGDWMSQYGSQDLAQQGDNFTTILQHYYNGVTIDGAGSGPTPPPPPPPPPGGGGGGKVYEQVWKQAPSYRDASLASPAGVLNSGQNYFYCQAQGAEVNAEGYHNNWWLKTDDDSGNRNVWVNAIYLASGSNDGQIPGVPVCAGSAPGPAPSGKVYKNVWATATSYSSPRSGQRVGVLHKGSNYFYCQAQGVEATFSSYRNNWWLKTDDDSGNRNVWVNATQVSGGSNDSAIPGVPTC